MVAVCTFNYLWQDIDTQQYAIRQTYKTASLSYPAAVAMLQSGLQLRASSMITTEQIKQLSTAEKLQVMETLWQELTAEGADKLASSAWHQQALQQTENAVREGEEVTHDWELAKQSLRNKFR